MSDERQRLEYTRIAPGGMAPMRALEHYLNAETGLEAVLLEMVRLRVSLLNGCAFCTGLHTHELRRHNEPEGRISGIAAWVGLDAYTQRERAALRWAEVLTQISGEVDEEEFRAAGEHFSEKELVDLSLAIASINAWNRLGVAFLPQWDESKAGGAKRSGDGSRIDAGSATVQTLATEADSEDDAGKVSQDEAGL